MTLPINISCENICIIPDGQTATDLRAGDFILTFQDGFYSKLIRIGQALRFRGKDAQFAKYTHTALVENNTGDLIEALGNGVVRSHISKYTPKEYVLVKILASDEDRTEMISFARYCLGEQYDWLDIVCIALSLLTGLKISMGFSAKQICSGLVSKALERTSAKFPLDNKSITPAHLAKWYLTSQKASQQPGQAQDLPAVSQ